MDFIGDTTYPRHQEIRFEKITLPFLTVPLRYIRGLGTAAQPGVLSFSTESRNGRKAIPPHQLERSIRDIICSDARVTDLEPFGNYFRILRSLLVDIQRCDPNSRDIFHLPAALCTALIKQDAGLFKESHLEIGIGLRRVVLYPEVRFRSRPQKDTDAFRDGRDKVLGGIQKLDDALAESVWAIEIAKSSKRRPGTSKDGVTHERLSCKRKRELDSESDEWEREAMFDDE